MIAAVQRFDGDVVGGAMVVGLFVESDTREAEVHFDGGEDFYGHAVPGFSRNEFPFLNRSLGLFVESEAEGTQHRDLDWTALFVDDELKDDGPLNVGRAGFCGVVGFDLAQQAGRRDAGTDAHGLGFPR
jgi:hypothetical protein